MKPPTKAPEVAQKEIDEAMKKVKEVQMAIANAIVVPGTVI